MIKVGQIEQKMGMTEREYIGAVNQCYIVPLRKFLEGEMKTIMRERSILENKRYIIQYKFQYLLTEIKNIFVGLI